MAPFDHAPISHDPQPPNCQTVENTLMHRAEALTRVLKVVANPHRVTILYHLAENGELWVNQLKDRMDLTQSTLSQHLAVLRHSGVVKTRRDANRIHYSLAIPELVTMLNGLSKAPFTQAR